MKRKEANAVAIRSSASLAALAWQKLEQSAKAALEADETIPQLRLVADTNGITAQISDEHGTQVVIQGGRVSVTTRPTVEE
jgi:hypothetical protein